MALLFGFRQVLYSLFKKGLSPNREAGGFFDGFIYIIISAQPGVCLICALVMRRYLIMALLNGTAESDWKIFRRI